MWQRVYAWGLRKRWSVRDDEYAIVCLHGIGDTLISCALAHRVTPPDRVVVAVQQAHDFLPALFDPRWRVVIIDKLTARSIKRWNAAMEEFRPGRLFYAHFPGLRACDEIGTNGLTLLDCYRRRLGVGVSHELARPRQPSVTERAEADGVLTRSGLPSGRTVLLFPGARSVPRLSPEWWARLSARLRGSGWTPAVAGPGPQIPGVKTLELPLRLVRACGIVAGWLICLRSGIADLLGGVDGCRLTVLYPDIRWFGGPLIDGCSVVAMGLAPHANEYVVSDPQDDALLERICSS